jgi:hypothetical protein
MNRSLAFCFGVFIAQLAVSQSIPLNGVVVIQNSQYETGQRQYVKDAAVRAPFAKPVTTDREGTFALAFIEVPNGAPVRIDVQKPGFKVVNTRDLGGCGHRSHVTPRSGDGRSRETG